MAVVGHLYLAAFQSMQAVACVGAAVVQHDAPRSTRVLWRVVPRQARACELSCAIYLTPSLAHHPPLLPKQAVIAVQYSLAAETEKERVAVLQKLFLQMRHSEADEDDAVAARVR